MTTTNIVRPVTISTSAWTVLDALQWWSRMPIVHIADTDNNFPMLALWTELETSQDFRRQKIKKLNMFGFLQFCPVSKCGTRENCSVSNILRTTENCHVRVKIVLKLFQPSSTPDWNNFISARGNLPEIISKLFRKLIAAHEYFSTCSMSPK